MPEREIAGKQTRLGENPMNFEDLMNPELQEKLKGARTPEELLAIAKDSLHALRSHRR